MAAPLETPPRISPALPLQGRTAIVTGASRGIGRTIATHLASLGADLVLGYATASALADILASDLNSIFTRAIAVQADVSDPAQVKTLFDRAESTFSGPAHILVACAGVLDPKYPTLAETSLQDWDAAFNVNARGAFLCCREAANRLTRGGRIIMITTDLVGGLLPNYGAYTASKAAVEAMTRIIAKELKGTGITANCVAPGPIPTDMFFAGKSEEMIRLAVDECPLERLGETMDVAPVVGFLASEAAGWVNGQVIRVNGGSV